MKSSEKKVWRTTSFVLQILLQSWRWCFCCNLQRLSKSFLFIYSLQKWQLDYWDYYVIRTIPAQVKVLILKSTNNFCRISQDLSSKTLPLWKTSVTFAKCSKTCIRVRVRACLYIHMPTCTLRRKQGCLLRPLFRPFILRIVADQTLRKSPVKRKRER